MLKKESQQIAASAYVIEVEIGQDTNGTYYAVAKDVPGLGAWGQTEEEAREHFAQGAIMYLRACFEHDDPLPKGVHQRRLPPGSLAPTYERVNGREQLILSA